MGRGPGRPSVRWMAAIAIPLLAVLGVTRSGAAAPHAVRSTHAIAMEAPGAFWLATPSGQVHAFGVHDYGELSGPLNQPVVAAVATGDHRGYWLVATDGGIFSFGDAAFFGSTGAIRLNQPIVGMAPTPDGRGYWLIASDGGVFSFGDAAFFGSTGAIRLNQPIVGMAPTPDAKGYWLVASDGGIFSFGDAAFFGSTGAIRLNQQIVGMAPTPDANGYWLVASDGGIFSFGDAAFFGSAAGSTGEPVERIVATGSGRGYWIVEQNGTALAYGDATAGGAPPLALLFTAATPGDRAVLFAFAQLGKPYIWGGNGPVGYDCSGLALAAWTNGAGVSFARVANDQYHTAGVPVALDALVAGDLVFWGSSQTDWTSVYHTALFVGGGQIVEATGNQVQLNELGQWGASDLMPNGRRP